MLCCNSVKYDQSSWEGSRPMWEKSDWDAGPEGRGS